MTQLVFVRLANRYLECVQLAVKHVSNVMKEAIRQMFE